MTRQKWVEKLWEWTNRQQKSFKAIKAAIMENAMAGADPERQFHLCTDASKRGVGGILLQLQDVPAGTEADARH